MRRTAFAVAGLFLSASTPIFGSPDHHHDHGAPAAVHKHGAAPAKQKAAPAEETRWGADYFPNVILTTHEGKSVRFFDDLIKDKVVAINFIYTKCPDSCPLETARLVTLQKLLGTRVGQDIFMYSITIDPAHDTPEVLKQHAEKFKVGPGWLFLTGKEEDITLLRQKLGLYQPVVEEGTLDHSLGFIIGNQKTGRWLKRSPFENSYVLAEQIGSWMHNWKRPGRNDYASAPKVRKVSRGEMVFRGNCTACHTIGGGDVRDLARGNLGPDLNGVTHKRDRLWLVRWLTNPEKMLADKDPIALELYAQFNNLVMPNFGLSEQDISAVIEYMEAESHRIEQTKQAAASSQN